MPPSAKPRVLVVTSTFPRWAGDAEPAFVLDLCKALAGQFDLTVLAPHCRGAAIRERLDGVEVHRFRYGPEWAETLAYEGGILPKLRARPWLWLLVPLFLAALVVAVARQLRGSFALVHAHWLIPQGAAVRLALMLAGSKAPLICTAHGADVFGLRGAGAQALQRWVAAGCARVGVVSAALGAELVARGVAADRLRTLSMGVTLAGAAAQGERDAGLVAFAGRIVEKKGLDVLLDAFTRVAAAVPAARLCIAGAGPELARLQRHAATLGIAGRATFLGAVPHAQVQALFGKAAVAVMPSVTASDGDAEGLGLVMLEAMAAGCPVVVTDLAVVRDVVRPEANALVFPERDSAALADALIRLLSDRALAARLAHAACGDVEARYGWGAVAARHAAAYAEALA